MRSCIKYRTVIFDLDGTLLDTLEDLADSLNSVLQEKGFPTHSLDAVRYFVGSGPTKLVSRALPETMQNEDIVAECRIGYLHAYKSNWHNKTRPYEGISELLDALTERHIHLAVLTNKPQDFARLCVEKFLSRWKFSAIVGQRDDSPMKPHPAGALEITTFLNVEPNTCLYLGDSDIDMTTAINAGMLPVGAAWGFRSEKELRQAGAMQVINHPMELMQIISKDPHERP